MSRMVGGTFGVAAMGALITGLGRAKIDAPAARRCPPAQRQKLADSLGAGGARVGGQVGDAVNEAFVYALNDGLRIGAAVARPRRGAGLAADRRSRRGPGRGRSARAPRSAAPRPRRRWPRSSERRHCPAPPLASAAPDAGPRHRRLDAIRALHEREEFFWLDLDSPSDADLDALGDAPRDPRPRHRGHQGVRPAPEARRLRRPRADRLLRRARRPSLVEVHVHVSGDEVVTVRRAPCAHLWEAREQRGDRARAHRAGPRLPRPRRAGRLAARARRPLRVEVERLEDDRLRAAQAGRPPAHERAALRALPPAADRRPPARHARAAAATLLERCPASSATSRATPSATSTTTSC